VLNNNADINATINNFIKDTFLPYIKQKDPDVELVYIYGNSEGVNIVNYGKDAIIIENKTIPAGAGSSSPVISIDVGGTRAEKTIISGFQVFQPFTMFLQQAECNIEH